MPRQLNPPAKSSTRASLGLNTRRYDADVKPTLYVETTIVSFLTARTSTDAEVESLQRLTLDWWTRRRTLYELRVSALVELEAGFGDADAARRRLEALRGLPRLAILAEVDTLAERLVLGAGIPPKAKADAVHLAIAAVHGVDYLLTWNMRHLANPRISLQVEASCRLLGYRAPTVCTPEQLMED